ncbi:MAG: hypothetical protein HKP12_15415 [Gammaproteobacteria bacterium]|nr:hypothetical protein [Gammaproteobacteria bacterium]
MTGQRLRVLALFSRVGNRFGAEVVQVNITRACLVDAALQQTQYAF